MRELVAWQEGSPLLVEDVGQGSALICLHGLGGGSYFFSGLSRSLEKSRRVLSFDMPGTGFNHNCVSEFSTEACVNATVELIDLVSPDPVVLVGHSMGTIVALKAYTERRDKVNGLIFLGGLPEPVPGIKQKLKMRMNRVQEMGMSNLGEEVMGAIFSESTLSVRQQMVGMYQ